MVKGNAPSGSTHPPAATPTGSRQPTTWHRLPDRYSISPMPMAILLMGLLPGALGGLWARTHEFFAEPPDETVKRWSKAGLPEEVLGRRLFDRAYPPISSPSPDWVQADPVSLLTRWKATGLKDKVIAQRLLDRAYPPTEAKPESGEPAGGSPGNKKPAGNSKEDQHAAMAGDPAEGVLYSIVSQPECDQLRSALRQPGELRKAMRSSTNEHLREFAARCPDDAMLKAAVEELLCPKSE